MLQTTSRLALLIQMLGITGTELANSVGIDPSLISKWKNNRRRVPGRTDTMRKIAIYLLALDDEQDGRTIRPLLNRLVKNEAISYEDSIDLLTQWLLEADQSDWFPDAGKNSEIRLDQNSYICPMEVFRGLSGRRIAALRFMDEIQSLPSGHHAYLMMQDDISWLDGDPSFSDAFMRKLVAWIASGHELDIIHWVDRKPEHLQTIIQHWLPIHLNSRVNSWYYPVYEDMPVPMSCFVVPGQLSLIGSKTDLAPEDYHTILYTDRATIRQCEWFFNSMRRKCVLLVENYAPEQAHLIVQRFAEQWEPIGKKVVSVHSRLPLVLGLPKESLLKIIEDNKLDGATRERLLVHWANYGYEKVPRSTSGYRVRMIHPFNAIEQALARNDYTDHLMSVMAGQPVKIGSHYLRELLLIMSEAVVNDPMFEVALTRTEADQHSAWPNYLIISNTFFTAWGDHVAQNQLFGSEATMVHAFERYFNDCWQKTPRVNRNELLVSGQLAELARY